MGQYKVNKKKSFYFWVKFKYLSFRDISSTSGKIKRAVLQFTPESWTHVRWLDPKSTYMRFWGVCQLVIFWQVSLFFTNL